MANYNRFRATLFSYQDRVEELERHGLIASIPARIRELQEEFRDEPHLYSINSRAGTVRSKHAGLILPCLPFLLKYGPSLRDARNGMEKAFCKGSYYLPFGKLDEYEEYVLATLCSIEEAYRRCEDEITPHSKAGRQYADLKSRLEILLGT